MTISDAMQDGEFNLRVSYGNRWLVAEGRDQWTIYEQKHRQRVRVVDLTSDEEKAVSILTKDDE